VTSEFVLVRTCARPDGIASDHHWLKFARSSDASCSTDFSSSIDNGITDDGLSVDEYDEDDESSFFCRLVGEGGEGSLMFRRLVAGDENDEDDDEDDGDEDDEEEEEEEY